MRLRRGQVPSLAHFCGACMWGVCACRMCPSKAGMGWPGAPAEGQNADWARTGEEREAAGVRWEELGRGPGRGRGVWGR